MAYQTMELECLSAYTKEEVAAMITQHIYSELEYVEEYFGLTKLAIVGSWVKGTNRPDSDLDVAFSYDGPIKDYSMCDILNMEPLYIDDLRVDFIPYSNHRGSQWEENAPMIPLPIEM